MAKFLDLSGLAHFWEKIAAKLDNKVDKVSGKQLSTEDFTTAEKEKLATMAGTTVDSALSSTSTNPVQNKVIYTELSGKVSRTLAINGRALAHDITLSASDVGAIPTSSLGKASGVAELDSSGKVPSSQLPSYVDDVIEATAKSNFPTTGEAGKIYVDTSTNKTYRWSGSAYAEISSGGVSLGTTSSTAGRGDWTKTAYDHSQVAHAPSNAEANVQSDWNVTDTGSDAFIKNKPSAITTAEIDALFE